MPAEGSAVFGPLNIAFPNNFGTKEYDIPDIYTSWKDGTVPNNGLAIYSPDSGCVNASAMFNVHTSDDPDPALRPYLKVVYVSEANEPVATALFVLAMNRYRDSDPVYQAVRDWYWSINQPTVYVSPDGNCGTKTPCYSKIQDAINNAATGSVILVKQGTYPESISLGSAKTLLVKGGHNSAYDQQTANTTFIQGLGQTTIKAPSGSLKFEMLTIKPPQ
jgi:hypothetical protein